MERWTLEFARAEDAGEPDAFREGTQEYLVRRDDGSFEALRWRWDAQLSADLAALRVPGHDPALPRRLGDRLRSWIGGAIRLDSLADACRRGARIELQIASAAAELYALPWELMTLPGSGAHLGALAEVQVSYRWPAAACAPPRATPRPEGGRILLAWSRAFGPVPARPIAEAIAAAAREGHVPWDISTDELADASLPALVAAIERDAARGAAPAVLHVLCHGAPIGGGYGLGLDDGRGGGVVVDSGALARALAPLAGHVRLVVLTACDSGDPGAPGTRLGSAAQELHRAGFEAVVASRLPLSGAGAVELAAALYHGLLVETCAIDQAVAAARVRLLRRPGALDWASVQLYRHPVAGGDRRPIVFRPYRGLLAFEGRHARFFFGREPETAEVLGDLAALVERGAPRLLVVAGASGTGKSSLVLAAVRPALARGGWATAALRPGAAPRRALADALAGAPGEGPLAVIVDQLEEVFTHADAAERRDFARALWDLVRRTDRTIAAIATLRVDFLARCGELVLDDAGRRLDEVAYDEAHRVFVAHMPAARLAEAITRPAARVGLRLEDGLVARLLRDVGEDQGALPLLQHVLDALWSRRDGDRITHAALDAIGGAFGAIERHADATVAALDPPARAQARRLLVRLASYPGDMSSGTRRRVAAAELRPPRRDDVDAFERAVAALIDARLVRRDDAGEALEVSHEALIRNWRALHGWYEAERERLAMHGELARLVEDSRRYGRALAGRALARAEALALAVGDELSPEAQALISASARAAARRRRSRALGLAALIVVLASATAISASFWARAEGLAATTRAQADALARELARSRDMTRLAIAERLMPAQPWAAAAILREIGDADLPGWRQAAFTAMQPSLPARILPPIAREALIAPGGAWLVAAEPGGPVRAWSLRGEPIVHVLPGGGPADEVVGLDVSPAGDGAALVAVGRRRGVDVWRLREAGAQRLATAPIATVPGYGEPVIRHVDGRLAVKTSGGLGVWRLAEGRLEPAALDLPCWLLAADRLICRGEASLELRTLAEPTRGEPVPAQSVEVVLEDGSLNAAQADGAIRHLAWDGERLIPTGFERGEVPNEDGRRYLAARGGVVYSAINQFDHANEVFRGADQVCRDAGGRDCVGLTQARVVAGVVDAGVVASDADSWQILNPIGLSTRQFVRKPADCEPLAPVGEWLLCRRPDGSAWVWSVEAGAHARETPLRRGVLGFQPERGRWLGLAELGPALLGEDDGKEAIVPLDLDLAELSYCSIAVFDADMAACACPYLFTVDWASGRPRIAVLEAGGPVHALHGRSRRVLYPTEDGLAWADVGGPTPQVLATTRLDEASCPRAGALAIAPDGQTAAVGCDGGRILKLALPSLATRASAAAPASDDAGPIVTMTFSPDGAELLVGFDSGAIDRIAWADERLARERRAVFGADGLAALSWTEGGLVMRTGGGSVAVLTEDELRPLFVPELEVMVGEADGLVAAGLTADRRLRGGTSHGMLLSWHGVSDPAGLRALLSEQAVYCPSAGERTAWFGESDDEAARAAQACATRWRELVAEAPR